MTSSLFNSISIFRKPAAVLLTATLVAGCTSTPQATVGTDSHGLSDWPHISSAIVKDPLVEAEVLRILSGMTLPQKIGQMTQAEIRHVTPAQITEFYLGSVLNGGGSWPQGKKNSSASDWVALADKFYDASMATDMKVKVPLIWGTDAVHGHGNAYGSTLFPHNIGLGATRDTELLEQMGAVVGRQVRATGINWVFAPTVAVARDDRWGRTYESFSEDAETVKPLSRAFIRGMQGQFKQDSNAVATAKAYMGDGASELGIDQGLSKASKSDMVNIHGQGYYGALEAGVQTVMASLSSWNDVQAGVNYGKMHGSKAMLTEALKEKMGFDGFVVTDWDGISQVDNCSASLCAQAINAGVDMVMAPEGWKAFIADTIKLVQRGDIPLSRIDDAVSRILRVKLRAGMFGHRPSANPYAGQDQALQARDLARRAVRQSMVLLKNNRQVLPLSRTQRVLVVGKSANSIANQSGGWSLTWQGTDTVNADFPVADTILDGVRDVVGSAQVTFRETAGGLDVSKFDTVVAVIGEPPYAEFSGDITLSSTLRHSLRYPEDLSVLQAVAGHGVPVVTVLLTGRPVYANDLINLSDAFVVGWLPGTEGKGVTDVLFRSADGVGPHDFSGRLSFSWPRHACQQPLNWGDASYDPQFAFGYGLSHTSRIEMAALALDLRTDGCGLEASVPIFNLTDKAPYTLYVSSAANQWARVKVGSDLNAILDLPADRPAIRVETTQINVQHDAKRVTWKGPAKFFVAAAQKQGVRSHEMSQGVLQFDMVVYQSPQAKVKLSVECGAPTCLGEVDFTPYIKTVPLNTRRTVKIPMLCMEEAGSDFLNMDIPFSLFTDQGFSAAFTNIQIVSGSAKDPDALTCADIGVELKL